MGRGIWVLVLVCWLTAGISAQDNSGGAAGSKLLALVSAWNRAEEKRDVRALDLIFDNAMIYIDEDGTLLNKTQFLSRVKQSPHNLESLVTQTIVIHVYGETAVVAGSYGAKETRGGKVRLRRGRFIDTWVLKDGAWVCVVAQSTPVPH